MPQGNDFSPVDASETVTLTWDFGPWLNSGVTVSSPSTSCQQISGTADPSPSSRLIGSPQIAASPSTKAAAQAIMQQVSAMIAGALYVLTATVDTSDNQVLTLEAKQFCLGPVL